MKFEVAESELSLLLKNNIMYVKKYCCEQPLSTYNHSAIKELFSNTAGFIRLTYLAERGEKISEKWNSHNSIVTRWLLIKEVGLFFNIGKVLLK